MGNETSPKRQARRAMDAPRRRNEMILLALFLLGCTVNESKALEHDASIHPTIQSIFEEEEKFERSLPPSANEDEYFAEMQDNGHMYKENKDTTDEMYQDDNIIGPNQPNQKNYKPITERSLKRLMFINLEGKEVQRLMVGSVKREKRHLCFLYGCTPPKPPPNPPKCSIECPPNPPSCAWYCIIPPRALGSYRCSEGRPCQIKYGPGCPDPDLTPSSVLYHPCPGPAFPCVPPSYTPACIKPSPSECWLNKNDLICPPPFCQKQCNVPEGHSNDDPGERINCKPTCVRVPRPPPFPCRKICKPPTPPCNPCPPCKQHCSLLALTCRCKVVSPGTSCLTKRFNYLPCCTPCNKK